MVYVFFCRNVSIDAWDKTFLQGKNNWQTLSRHII